MMYPQQPDDGSGMMGDPELEVSGPTIAGWMDSFDTSSPYDVDPSMYGAQAPYYNDPDGWLQNPYGLPEQYAMTNPYALPWAPPYGAYPYGLPVAQPAPVAKPQNRPRPALGNVLRMIADPLRAFGLGNIRIGEAAPPMPADVHDALPDDAHMELHESRIAEPYGLLAQAPALLGAQALLQHAVHVASTYPDVSTTLPMMLATAQRIVDAETARMLGMEGAGESIHNARASSLNRVAQAFELAEALLSDNDDHDVHGGMGRIQRRGKA